jgi:hypothetical protein
MLARILRCRYGFAAAAAIANKKAARIAPRGLQDQEQQIV